MMDKHSTTELHSQPMKWYKKESKTNSYGGEEGFPWVTEQESENMLRGEIFITLNEEILSSPRAFQGLEKRSCRVRKQGGFR